MHIQKPVPGAVFPPVTVPRLGGGTLDLADRSSATSWKLVVVYRGRHCPICTRYLDQLNTILPDLTELGVDVAAVSADSEIQATEQLAQITPGFPVGYDLSIAQMQTLGLYISGPRSGTDVLRPFAEPGLFVINEDGVIRIADISNVPFARPGLQLLLGGLKFLRGRADEFPINGTHA